MDRNQIDPNSVQLIVHGIKAFIPISVAARANLDSTWEEFLNKKCDVRVCVANNLLVSSSSYIHGKSGWYGELTDTIRPFIDNYAVRRDKYKVRLIERVYPDENFRACAGNIAPIAGCRGYPSPVLETEQPTTSSAAAGSTQKLKKRGFAETGHSSPSRPAESVNQSLYTPAKRIYRRAREPEEEMELNDVPIGGENVQNEPEVIDLEPLELANEPDRGVHAPTAAPAASEFQFAVPKVPNLLPRRPQARTLPHDSPRRPQAQTLPHDSPRRPQARTLRPDMKSVIKAEFDKKFTNSMLLRVDNEIRSLKDGCEYSRNVQYAPMAYYFLQNLFGIE